MTMILKSAVVVTTLALASPLYAKPLSITVDMANFRGPPAYAAAYITDPKAWLGETLGESKVKTKMTYKHRKNAEDMAAYLVTVSPSDS